MKKNGQSQPHQRQDNKSEIQNEGVQPNSDDQRTKTPDEYFNLTKENNRPQKQSSSSVPTENQDADTQG
jgi:hypothetical protein